MKFMQKKAICIYMEIKERKHITFHPQAKANVLMGASFALNSFIPGEIREISHVKADDLCFVSLRKTINFSQLKHYFSEEVLP